MFQKGGPHLANLGSENASMCGREARGGGKDCICWGTERKGLGWGSGSTPGTDGKTAFMTSSGRDLERTWRGRKGGGSPLHPLGSEPARSILPEANRD